LPNPSPLRISVRTPPPNIAIASGLNLNHLDDPTDSHVDVYASQVSLRELSIDQASFEPGVEQERLAGLDAAMEIEPEIEHNFCRMTDAYLEYELTILL